MRGLPEIFSSRCIERLRIERPIPPPKARREIRHAERTLFAMKSCHEDRGIAIVVLFALRVIFEFDRENARTLRVRRRAEQAVKHRITVEARRATPDDTGVAVDQGFAKEQLADDAKVEVAPSHGLLAMVADEPAKPSAELTNIMRAKSSGRALRRRS